MPPAPPTADPVVARVLAGLVGLALKLAPGRVVSVYLSGSHASDTANDTSDVDLLVLLKDGLAPAQIDHLTAIFRDCARLTPMLLDVVVCTEREATALGALWFSGANRLLYGSDFLARWRGAAVAPPTPRHVRYYLDAAANILLGLRDGRPFDEPLSAPDPADEWLGFCRWPIRHRDGTEEPSSRALVVSTFWLANSLLAARGLVPEVYKTPAVAERFREAFGGEWYPFLRDVFGTLRGEWQYRLPSGAAGRRRLRGLCEDAVRFQAHFLQSAGRLTTSPTGSASP